MLETHLLSSSLRALVFALSCAIGLAQVPCSVGSPNIHEGQYQFLPYTTVDADVTLVWWTMGSCPCDPCEMKFSVSVTVWQNPLYGTPKFEMCFQDEKGMLVCFETNLELQEPSEEAPALTYVMSPSQPILFQQVCGTSTRVELYSDLGIGVHYLLAGLTAMCWSCAD